MSWMVKLSQAEYLGTLGAPPETINWIMSQPNPQFFVNQFRKNPRIDVTTLQAPQKRQYEPTERELQRVSGYASEESNIRQWALVQLRKFRVSQYRIQNNKIDYFYAIPMTTFDNKLLEINDWYRMTNADENVRNIEIASYSWDQALAASDEWHAVAAGEGAGKIYAPVNPKLIMFRPPEWNGWSIQKVVSRNDLLVEGHLMNHCVGKYCNEVATGASEIYSLRDENNEPHVTLEIDPSEEEVVQVMGNSDVEPDDEYKEYIKQWFAELKKTRPELTLRGDDFDFGGLKYVENREIDEEINRIIYQGNEYGLVQPLNSLDIEDAYDAVMNELTGNGYRGTDTRNVSHIGPAIASAAWEADKQRAEYHGMMNIETASAKFRNVTDDARIKLFIRESGNYGVKWLWDKIQENNDEFYKNFDFYESYLDPEGYETEEELENAQDEERNEAESAARDDSLPYALDDAIAETLVQLAKEDPFLPEHFKQLEQTPVPVVAQSKNWLIKLSQDLPFSSVENYGRRFETGVPVEFRYIRNLEKSPNFGQQFQQDIEPAGRYMIHQENPGDAEYLKKVNWETDMAKFENPLVIEFNVDNDVSYNEHNWKAALSRKFGGLKGETLSRAIVGQGYDGIVTIKKKDGVPFDTGEIVDLRMFR